LLFPLQEGDVVPTGPTWLLLRHVSQKW
jgi:hypothetical protein